MPDVLRRPPEENPVTDPCAPFRRARALAAFVLALASAAAYGGPGSSGGNPSNVIASLKRNYQFVGPPPLVPKFSSATDSFDFGLAGYRLDVAVQPYDAALCGAVNVVKTVCAQPDGSTLVVFGDHATFHLRFTDTGIGAARLADVAAQISASFTPGAVSAAKP